jgi:AcrR family transcriptional regulator
MAKGLDIPLILQVAAEIADQEGLDSVTLSTIANKLGVKTPSLYNHIQGLSDLRKHLAIYGIGKLKHVVTESTVGKSGDDAVLSMGLAYVSFVRSHPGLYEATLAATNFTDKAIQMASQEVVQVILLVLKHYDLEPNQAIHMVRGLRSIVHGFASIEMRNGFRMELDLDESLKEILLTFIRGLKA